MRWSQLYTPTLREDPTEADATSHRLLLRAGYIRQLSAGHYSLLPLATRVRSNIIAIIRDEMQRIGGQEFLLPTVHPAEVWKRAGRWDKIDETLFRLTDRKGEPHALGMTHEEVFTTLAEELRSYKQLPQVWYQFQTKLRDEARPKSGLLRVREFTMKDSYSFDLNAEGLDAAFDRHDEAYRQIFRRLGVPATAVQASSGDMGGSTSVEFMCPTDAGEDLIVECPACGYAANTEKATSALPPIEDPVSTAAAERFNTPDARTIEDLARDYDAPAEQQIKTLVYMVGEELSLVLLRGDHPLMEQKLADATGKSIRPAQGDEIRSALGADPGSLGALGVSELPIYADVALQGRREMVTGANENDQHLRHVDVERDIDVTEWLDLREVRAGEACPHCGTALEIFQAVEVGHIFKLGSKYTDVFNVRVLDENGKQVTPVMGSYGIGVERAMAAIVETHNDERGIVWPVSVAPFQVVLSVLGKDAELLSAAEKIYTELQACGVEVLLDDRRERPGVKLADAELVGVPFRITFGKRSVGEGTAELTARSSGQTEILPLEEIISATRKRIASE